MDRLHIEQYAQIPQPARENFGFLENLKKPMCYSFRHKDSVLFSQGVKLSCHAADIPDSALVSLKRLFDTNGIGQTDSGYPIDIEADASLSHEEFTLLIRQDKARLTASDEDGFRRGIYYLEDRIRGNGGLMTPGEWRRRPFVRHRISRCFFGPTNRPPFFIDELMNDVDYYPEEYLNKLAHEDVNGLWLTMYFRDLPSSIFPGRGKDAPRRLAKLRQTVEKCLRYGIRIYLFFSEPKYFGDEPWMTPFEDAVNHPEVIGSRDTYGLFCLSTDAGKKYIEESISTIFEAVPKLGGAINIMLGEDNGSCLSHIVSSDPLSAGQCPVCTSKNAAKTYRDIAEIFVNAMHKYNPQAEFIGWFYAPWQRDGSEFMQRLLDVASHWPDNATIMFNFESGAKSVQLNKNRVVFDYSLAFIGPSRLFDGVTARAKRTGAKLQVGCSHENASVPFMPVPANLYEKYRYMHNHGVSTAMQCWYFGNYPGVMNKAAGELSFEPFPDSCKEFLVGLARPEWQADAEQIAEAWECFSQAYRHFPSNICFEWYGPLHHCIAWPWHLFPTDTPISPSWILKNFPEVSGDRIGECLSYLHTLPEAITLCTQMSDGWQQGLKHMLSLRPKYSDNTERLADISLAEAIGLQMRSTTNLLKFYYLREDMLYNRIDHLDEMKKLAIDEIENTRTMIGLCLSDSRLGYHSEAEGYLFFPQKLEARITLLQELLDDDFPKFDLNAAWIDEYTGKTPTGKSAILYRDRPSDDYDMGGNLSWRGRYDDDTLYLTVKNGADEALVIDLVPCRLWPSMRIHIDEQCNHFLCAEFGEVPAIHAHKQGPDLLIETSLSTFNEFRHKDFPIQFNIFAKDDHSHWVAPQPWPNRLAFVDFNPKATGWIFLR